MFLCCSVCVLSDTRWHDPGLPQQQGGQQQIHQHQQPGEHT